MNRRDFLKLLASTPLLKRIKFDELEEELPEEQRGLSIIERLKDILAALPEPCEPWSWDTEEFESDPYFHDGGISIAPQEQLQPWDDGGAAWLCSECKHFNSAFGLPCENCNNPYECYTIRL